MDCLAEISKIIDRHRAKVFIPCEESCWCWDVEAAILGYSESAKEHSVASDGEGRCACGWYVPDENGICIKCGTDSRHR